MDLPSVYAAKNFHAGKPGALLEVILSTIGRAALIGTGIYAFTKERDLRKIATYSIAGATAVEFFVLYYTRPSNVESRESLSGTAKFNRLNRIVARRQPR